ncbi:cytidylyltransferase domain-containing protein [Pseudomonadota bacterium]
MSLLAIIPARGGSKGIPGKNLVKVGGRSLVARAVDAAKLAEVVTDIFVTTDDDAIAGECEAAGVPVAYRRPAHLAADETGMMEVVFDALDRFNDERGADPESLVLLQPTCPFRSAEDIEGAWGVLEEGGHDSVVSVHEMRESPYECVRENKDGYRMLADPGDTVRRQDYQDNFHFINGAVYVARTEYVRREKVLFREGETGLFHMDPLHGIDIDLPGDLLMAQALVDHPEFLDRLYAEDHHVHLTDVS